MLLKTKETDKIAIITIRPDLGQPKLFNLFCSEPKAKSYPLEVGFFPSNTGVINIYPFIMDLSDDDLMMSLVDEVSGFAAIIKSLTMTEEMPYSVFEFFFYLMEYQMVIKDFSIIRPSMTDQLKVMYKPMRDNLIALWSHYKHTGQLSKFVTPNIGQSQQLPPMSEDDLFDHLISDTDDSDDSSLGTYTSLIMKSLPEDILAKFGQLETDLMEFMGS